MSIKIPKLPPLPHRKNSDNNIRINCQRIFLQPKYNSIDKKLGPNGNASNDIDLSEDQYIEKDRRQETKSSETIKSRQSCRSIRSSYKRYINHTSSLKNIYPSLPLPNITAKSWVLYQMKQQKCIQAKRNYKRRQIASLTKMINLITVLELIESMQLNPLKIRVFASEQACSVTGTTAQLKKDVIYNLNDLYYGMMLPSGNDAAYQIAQIGGALISMHNNDKFDINVIYNEQRLSEYISKGCFNFVNIYLKRMNKMAKKILMNNSHFANPHGLSNTSNLSSAEDVAKLCTYSMKNTHFRKIVNTKIHHYTYIQNCKKEEPQTSGSENSIELERQTMIENKMCERNGKWQNTNRMLGEGWSGIKTGITPNAGPCLAASFHKVIYGKQYQFLVVLLNSQSMEARWNEVRNLVNWAIETKSYI